MNHWVLETLLAARAARAPVALITRLDGGAQSLVFAAGGEQGDLDLSAEAMERVRAAIDADESQVLENSDGRLFVHVFNPPARMIVVGAVHIAEPLVRMAVLMDYAVTLVDPRQAFTGRDRFDGVAVRTDWPDEALEVLAPDRRTAIVALTHDPKLDDAALAVALTTPAFYIGALGSRKTQAARLERLRQQGIAEEALARIRGPVGLAIGARSPAEIAVSILAEVTQARRLGPGDGR